MNRQKFVKLGAEYKTYTQPLLGEVQMDGSTFDEKGPIFHYKGSKERDSEDDHVTPINASDPSFDLKH